MDWTRVGGGQGGGGGGGQPQIVKNFIFFLQ